MLTFFNCSQDIAQEVGIRAMPTFMVFKNGEKGARPGQPAWSGGAQVPLTLSRLIVPSHSRQLLWRRQDQASGQSE